MSTVKERLKVLSRDDLIDAFKKTTKRMEELFRKKAEDYDIEYYKQVGAFGLLLRIKEKELRLNRLLQKDGEPECEPIEDNIRDLSVLYSALLSMFEFDLVSVEQLKEIYAQVLQMDLTGMLDAEEAEKKKKKWWHFWKK